MELTLIDKEHLIDNVWAFRFTPSQPLNWTPGQYMQVELPHDTPDTEGTKRWFTVSSAPYEHFLQISTRITESTFKQALSKLEIGDTVKLLETPHGDFTWQQTNKPLVFVAGGIGVTPFRSILLQRSRDDKNIPVILIYGGRSDDLPFKDEFDLLAKTHPEFTVHYAVGAPLTAEKIAELVPDLNESLVYVSGPEPMVEALGAELKNAGLPEDQLKQDFFPNYRPDNY